MGPVSDFVAHLRKWEETDEFKEFNKYGAMPSIEGVMAGVAFVMRENKGSMDPRKVKELIYLEYHI